MSWTPLGPALLFCPADRPDRFAKAAAAADMVILDLEDGVNAGDRAAARASVTENLLDPQRTILRVNPVDSVDFRLDLEALDQTPYSMVMLAKTESGEQVEALAGRRVIALCETARGVLESSTIAAAGRSLTLPPGLRNSSLPINGQGRSRPSRSNSWARRARQSPPRGQNSAPSRQRGQRRRRAADSAATAAH